MIQIDLSAMLDIPDVVIDKTELTRNGELLIYVRSTKEGTTCHRCGKHITTPYGFDTEHRIRHLSVFGKPCYIVIRQPRYKCDCETHSTTTQKPAWRHRNSPNTIAFEKHILLLLVNSTIEDVSIKESIGYGAIEGILERHLKPEVDWTEIKSIKLLGIDEISLRKGHQHFVTLVTCSDEAEGVMILGILEGRKKETVKKFFRSIPKRLRKTVRFVCSDMYDGFVNAVKEEFGNKVKVVIDRFHVAKLYRSQFDEVRKSEMRRLKKLLPPDKYKQLKNVMWILRKNPTDLTNEELGTLKFLFSQSKKLETAYTLMNNLTSIFDGKITRSHANKKMLSWINSVKKSGLDCFDKFISTLENMIGDILNYFIHRQTSGFVEGLNNKVKVLKRRCYGLFDTENLFRRLTLDLRGYALFYK